MDEKRKGEEVLYQESLFPDEVPEQPLNGDNEGEIQKQDLSEEKEKVSPENLSEPTEPNSETEPHEDEKDEGESPADSDEEKKEERDIQEPSSASSEESRDEERKSPESSGPAGEQPSLSSGKMDSAKEVPGEDPGMSFQDMISKRTPKNPSPEKDLEIPNFFEKKDKEVDGKGLDDAEIPEKEDFWHSSLSKQPEHETSEKEDFWHSSLSKQPEYEEEEDEDYDEEDAADDAKFIKTMKILGVVLGVIVAAALIGVLFFFNRPKTPIEPAAEPTSAPTAAAVVKSTPTPSAAPSAAADTVTLENMNGWTVQEVRNRFAKEDMKAHGITYHTRECYNPAAAGTAYSTTPNPGSLKDNSSVLVYISKGNYTIPDLRGSDYTSARQISADAAGGCLALNLTYEDVDSDQTEGTIVDIVRNGSSAVGTAASNGDYVVQVAKHFSVSVPNFEGWRKSDAEVWCKDHGLIPDITGQYTSGYTDGTVISNNMDTVKRGDHVSILVSLGEYEPSDYTGRNFEELRKEVSNAISSGANVTMMTTYEDSAQPAGTVISEYFDNGYLEVTISTGKEPKNS